ncbi:MAG: hypothetical protein IJF01_08160 [Tidjanibacter sp.]|nr:hypothetical protein [Tidjanibacter sp.]
MKATKFFALAFSLLAVSCTNELVDDSIEQNKNYEDGIVLTLNGAAQNEDADSRIFIDGSKSDGKYIVKWRNEDAIGIFSADGTTINNVKAAETTVESGKTAATASFDTEAAVPAERGDDLYIYYPYKADIALNGSKLTSNVPVEQTGDLTVQTYWGDYALAYDKATVGEGGSVNFSLQHPLAYVKVKIEATDYVKNWITKGIQIVDRNGVAKLAGDITVDLESGDLSVANSSSVVNFVCNSSTKIVEIPSYNNYAWWLVSAPWDFTGSDVWVVVKFYDPENGATYTIPVQYENAQLKANTLNVINLTLTAESNSAKGWYEPIDTRLMPGLGYAYGEQNTYLIQCKSGSTYTGATYTPNADIPNAVKVDIRGRGDFSKIVDVTKATFEWFKLGVQTNGNGNRTVYVGGTSNYAGANVDATKYTIDDSTKAQGYITVTNTGAYAGSPILLMKVDNKVVWAWYFWNISADGTQLEGVDVGNGNLLANMLIGQNTTNFAAWGSNPKSTTSSLAQPAYRFVAYYQHGRFMPAAFWTSYWSIDDGVNAESKDTGDKVDGMVAGGTPVVRTGGAISLAEALARPVGIIINTADNTNQAKWCSDELMDLWGAGTNNANAAVKTVFDPCPKGWRVADYSSYNTIVNNKANTTLSSYTGAPGLVYKDVVFLATGYINGKTAANGRMNTMGGSETPTNASSVYAVEWSNFVGSATASQPKALYSKTNASTTTTDYLKIGGFNRSNAHAVRCQKDTDNR